MRALQNRLIMMTGWRRHLLAVVAGALTVLALAPYHIFIVAFATFPVLVFLLDGAVAPGDGGRLATLRPAFVTGWLFGFGYFLGGLWWVGRAMLVEAETFAFLAPVAVLGLPALLAIFTGLGAVVARLFWSGGIGRVFALAAGLALAELARTHLLTGFPWNHFGYAAMPAPMLMQSAAVIGLQGVGLLAILAFSLPATLAGNRRQAVIGLALLVALVGAHAGFGGWRLVQAGPVPAERTGPLVRIVQPSIDQSVKADPAAAPDNFARLLDLTRAAGLEGTSPEIIFWPETAMPFILTRTPEAVVSIADTLEPQQVLVAGGVREEGDGDDALYYNSILVIDGEGIINDAADKVHLVPFGEYLPLKGLFESVGLRTIAAADRGYEPGSSRELLSIGDRLTVMASICYEIIFPAPFAAIAPEADAIINLTNDAWFGRSGAPWQHSLQARLRAVETGTPLVRAANSGISGVYDGYGRAVEAPLGLDVVGAMDTRLPERLATTAYVRSGTIYLAVLFAIVLFVCISTSILQHRLRGR